MTDPIPDLPSTIDTIDAKLRPYLGSMVATSAAIEVWHALRRAGLLRETVELTDLPAAPPAQVATAAATPTEVLRAYEGWEAELRMGGDAILSPDGVPRLTRDLFDQLTVLGTLRQQVLDESKIRQERALDELLAMDFPDCTADEAVEAVKVVRADRAGHETIGLPQTYQPDPAEEAYYASPAGLRASAAQCRGFAALQIKRAEELEAEAEEKERANG